MLPAPCADRKNHNCLSKVAENVRILIYNDFRNLDTIEKQRQFILTHVERRTKKRTTRNITDSRKSFTNHYSFTVNGEKKIVCRLFFMNTLNVTDAFVRCSLDKQTLEGFLEPDKRGKHVPHNKLTAEDVAFIRDHITSFPSVESHYCRKKSLKWYLDSQLNISIMYRLYKDKCTSENRKPASMVKYRRIFQEYNLGFFKPKKDQCRKCLAYGNFTQDQKAEQELLHKEHLERKEDARKCRDNDKHVAQGNSDILAFNFDLQSVLSTPKGPAGQIFYLRKLAVYNLTIYNLGNQNVSCYLWDETQGNRGANEISTCIFMYIMNHPTITGVRMMSDGCGGQQKNSIFASMCHFAIANHPTLKTIDHKFFETGHTEMECDSIHSKIEKKSKFVPVYVPEGWAQLIRDARINPKPFDVINLMFNDFFDFKSYAISKMKLNIPWRSVCWLHYAKDEPLTIFFKTSFKERSFLEQKLKRNKGRHPKKEQLEKAYQDNLSITNTKYADLAKMCKDGTIPPIHHPFYRGLKTDGNKKDRLPEPNFDEESDYE